jgi:type IV pilus assembly protein PilQ
VTQSPARIALDFAGVTGGVGRSTVEINQANVQSANVVQTDERSRVVLSLKRAASYALQMSDRALLVTLEPAASAPPSEPAQNRVVAQRRTEAPLGAIDFRRAGEGAGRVRLALPSSKVTADIKQVGSTLVVELSNVSLPERLRRRLDVSDFGTPVQTVTTTEVGDRVRMVVAPQGEWEHTAYQTESELVIDIKPLKIDPRKLTQGAGYNGQKLSLNFQNVDIRALLQVIADFTNLNIVVRDSVAGNLTLRLKDVPWDQALDIVLQSTNLDMRKNGNVILVAPRDELATQEKLELESKLQISEIEPSRLEVFQLNYQKAEAVQKLLSDEKQKVLSKTGSAVTDIRTNKLFVRDTGARLDEVRRIISQLDVPVRQVLIEARIVEADDLFSRNLGVKLGYNDLKSTYYTTASQIDPVTGQPVAINVPVYGAGSALAGSNAYSTLSGNLQGVGDLSSQLGCNASGTCAAGIGRPTALANTNFVNLPAAAIAGSNPASFAISLFGSSLTRFLNLEISALEADQRGKVVSSPRVLAADQGRAVIEQGTELPYQSATSSGATSISFKKATLRLEVVPQITPEGNVIMKVKVNRDAVGRITPAGFAIDTRAVETDVLVENGGTVVIGGIYEQVESNQVNKVPFLGDIPILGALFRNTTRTNNKTELLVFLTPRVVADATAVR